MSVFFRSILDGPSQLSTLLIELFPSTRNGKLWAEVSAQSVNMLDGFGLPAHAKITPSIGSMAIMGDQYEQFYRNAGPRLGEWRDLGAKHKGNHILEIIGNRRCASLIEIGCGDGALLEYIHRQRPDIRLVGYEIADDPVERARRRGLEEIEVFDGSHVPTADDSFDIAILSHVLEHVPDPVGTLVEAGRIASTVVGEVPLEDTLASHRASYVPAAKVIGHIQKFSPKFCPLACRACRHANRR